MEPQLLDGKAFGVFLIVEVADQKDEYFCLEGMANWDGQQLSIVSPSADEQRPFPIPANTFHRIKPVDDKMRLVFKTAEYYVAMLAKPLAEDADRGDYAWTGHQLPIVPDS